MNKPRGNLHGRQFSLRGLLIAIACLGVELASAPNLLFNELPLIPHGFLNFVVALTLISLPIGGATGAIAGTWKAVAYGTAAGMVFWCILGSVLAMVITLES